MGGAVCDCDRESEQLSRVPTQLGAEPGMFEQRCSNGCSKRGQLLGP